MTHGRSVDGSGRPRRGAVVWLAARGGRVDRARIVLTAIGTALGTLALLCAATVGWMRPGDGPYTSDLLQQTGLHQGIVVAFVLLCVPVLGFVGQCSRIGAPARDRRLASLRMAGATPADAIRVVAAETGLAAGSGSLLGLAVYLVGRIALDQRVGASVEYVAGSGRSGGALRLPTDVLPPVWMIAVIVVGLPIVTTAFARAAMKRVVLSPFGVLRPTISRPPSLAPVILVGGGGAAMASLAALADATGLGDSSPGSALAVFVALFVVTAIGLGMGAASIAAAIGRSLAGRVRSPALLIAARRLAARPYDASRANTVVMLGGLVGGLVLGVRAGILASTDPSDHGFYAGALDLVDLAVLVGIVLAAASVLVTTVEGVISRRRALAALVATGTPRAVLARATLAEAMLPLVPMFVLASVLGEIVARGFSGSSSSNAIYDASGNFVRSAQVAIPIPWTGLAVLVVGALAATAAITSLALLFLPASTDPSELRAT